MNFGYALSEPHFTKNVDSELADLDSTASGIEYEVWENMKGAGPLEGLVIGWIVGFLVMGMGA